MSEIAISESVETLKTKRPRRKSTCYSGGIYDCGNVLTIKVQVPLQESVVYSSFDMPLRASSYKYLYNGSCTGVELVRRMADEVPGVTRVELRLYECVVELGGIFERRVVLKAAEKALRQALRDTGYVGHGSLELLSNKPRNSIELKPAVATIALDPPQAHPFGLLARRIHEFNKKNRRVRGS